jgi:hypothetical protein
MAPALPRAQSKIGREALSLRLFDGDASGNLFLLVRRFRRTMMAVEKTASFRVFWGK